MIEIILIVGFTNLFIGFVIGTFRLSKFTDFENNFMPLILILGLAYWLFKLVTYPLFKKTIAKKKKQVEIKKAQDKLIENLRWHSIYGCDVSNITYILEKLKDSINGDLYSRALDAYKDMLSIVIKCSDGEGKLDTKRFDKIIKETIKECSEIVDLAYDEHKDRLKKAKNQYYDSKEEEIKQDLENMRKKNRAFRELWEKGDE